MKSSSAMKSGMIKSDVVTIGAIKLVAIKQSTMKWGAMCSVALLFWLSGEAWSGEPEDAYGVWSGMLTEVIVAGRQYQRYEAVLTLAPNNYHIDYESLGCGGSLRLLLKKGRFLKFRDELSYGLDACSNGGRTELHIIGPERAAFQWFDADGVLKAEGYLKRHRQVMT